MEFIVFLISIAVYFLPTLNAISRDHQQKFAIAVVNLVSGWTVAGWFAALLWSCLSPKEFKPSSNPEALYIMDKSHDQPLGGFLRAKLTTLRESFDETQADFVRRFDKLNSEIEFLEKEIGTRPESVTEDIADRLVTAKATTHTLTGSVVSSLVDEPIRGEESSEAEELRVREALDEPEFDLTAPQPPVGIEVVETQAAPQPAEPQPKVSSELLPAPIWPENSHELIVTLPASDTGATEREREEFGPLTAPETSSMAPEPPRENAPHVEINVAPSKVKSFWPVPATRTKIDWEALIGGSWLNIIGIVILVVGMAMLTEHSYREFGPVGRLTMGVAVALGLLLGGLFLERGDAKYRILSRTLMGGGWAILYFMAYAAHNVEAARVIDSPVTGLLVMMAVATAMILHSLAFRSQLVTGLAYGLAFFAIGLTPVTTDSLVACAILAVSQVVILRLYDWQTLALVAVVGGYLNHWRWINRLVQTAQAADYIIVPPDRNSYWLSLAIIGFYWLLMVTSLLLRAPRDRREKVVQLTVAVANTIGMLGVATLQIVTFESQDLYLLVGVATPAYAVAAFASWRVRRHELFLFNGAVAGLLYASTLPLALKPFSIDPGWLSVYWLFGGLIIMALSVRLQQPVLRVEAYVLCAGAIAAALQILGTTGAPTDWQSIAWWLAPATAIGLVALSEALQLAAGRELIPLLEGARIGPVWGYIAIGIFVISTQQGFSPEQGGLALLVGGAALFELGADLKRPHLRIQAYLLLLACTLQLVAVNLIGRSDISLWKTAAPAVPFFYYVYWRMRVTIWHADFIDWAACQAASWVATLVLASILWREMDSTLVPLLWLFYALALLETGARTELRSLRAQAYLLCGAAFYALLVYNLGTADPATSVAHSTIVIASAAMFYSLNWRLSRAIDTWPSEIERSFSDFLSGAGTVLLTALMWQQTEHALVGVLWLVFAVILMEVGIATKHIALRVQAYTVSILALLSILIFDLGLVGPISPSRGILVAGAATIFYYFYLRATLGRSREWRSEPEWSASYLPSFAAAALLSFLAWREIDASHVSLAWLGYAVILFEIGARTNRGALRVQAHLLGLAAFLNLFTIGVDEAEFSPVTPIWLSLIPAAAVYYFLSWRMATKLKWDEAETRLADLASGAGSALVSIVIWRNADHSIVGLPWLIFGMVLFETGNATQKGALRLQAYLLAATALIPLLVFDSLDFFGSDYRSETDLLHRALIVGSSAAIYYFFFWRISEKHGGAALRSESTVADILSFAASGLLALTIWSIADPHLIGVFWLLLAVPLFEIGVRKERFSLQLQACLLIIVAFAVLLAINLYEFRLLGISHRDFAWDWAIVSGAAATYYYLSWRIYSGAQVDQRLFGQGSVGALSLVGTTLLAVLIWRTGSPTSVAIGWAFMAIVLYEIGRKRSWISIERQGHVMAALAFGRLFLANFVVSGDIMGVSYRVLTISPVIVLFYFMWGQTREVVGEIDTTLKRSGGKGLRLSQFYSYGAAFLLFALARFELGRNDWIMGLAPIVLALLIAGHLFGEKHFRYQSYIIAILAFARTWSTNVFLQGSYYGASERVITILPLLFAYMAATVFCLRFPAERADLGDRNVFVRRLDLIDENADQMFALLSTILCALLIFFEVPAGWVASAWAVEAIALILLGFKFLKSGYRYYGLILLLFSILKFAVLDLKGKEPIYYIMLGVILLIASFIYSRHRNVLKKYIG